MFFQIIEMTFHPVKYRVTLILQTLHHSYLKLLSAQSGLRQSDFFASTKDCFCLKSYPRYIEEQLRKLPIEKLWEIIEELLLLHPNMPDKTAMNYEQVLELCIILKESDEMFRNLEQIAILRSEIDDISKHKT